MVRKIEVEGRGVYLCEACGFGYADEALAKECEEYCNAHHSCSLAIIRRAVYRP